ncbi:hypothetical protein J7443_17590 [Tropicibacter sp. R15_0]|uniref:hypothetical protein n=1 Tax=Tropicibacter sp. R15_0 TaxID=2821101 RepID=UPI001ADD3D62|nr:hypothetical protein [Tropicibacter sp. R15_0]MBO9467061.1 hypothetical protein [Tropicibacter sp. R15_0]
MLKGKDGAVLHGSSRDRAPKVQNWNLDEQVDVVAGWGMGDEAEEAFGTIKRYSGSFEYYLKPGDPADDIRAGDVIPVEFYPGGETSGSGYFTGDVLVTGTPMSGSKDGIPTRTVNFRNASGTLQRATVT